MCQLGVTIEGSVARRTGSPSCSSELEARGPDAFKPHFWLSDEWFSPDGVPGVAIPFYLAHPAARAARARPDARSRRRHAGVVHAILRHEAGHAIDNAYKLRQRRRRQQIFGPSYKAYPAVLHAEAVQQELRAASRQLVRAEPSRRGLRRDVRGLAEPAVGLARALCGLAGDEEARIHGRADEGPRRQADAGAARSAGSIRCRHQEDAARALRAQAPPLRRRCTRTSTIAICGGCSPIVRSTPAT